jgi:hypothetical protein
MSEVLPDGSIGRYQGYCPKCKAVISTNMQGNEIGYHICKRIAKYKIVRQSDRKIIKCHSLGVIADYFDVDISFVKLHLDKQVQLNGWEIKSI